MFSVIIISHQTPKEGWFSNNVCDKVIKRKVAWGSRAKSCWVYTGRCPTSQIGAFLVKGQKKDSKIWRQDNHDRWLGENNLTCTWKCTRGTTSLMTRTSVVWRRGHVLTYVHENQQKLFEIICYGCKITYKNSVWLKGSYTTIPKLTSNGYIKTLMAMASDSQTISHGSPGSCRKSQRSQKNPN